jgi:hypothetical protein
MSHVKLRGNQPRREGPYPLGEIPWSAVLAIGKAVIHRVAVGLADITGDDFGHIFASAIGGTHRLKPLGVADVELEQCAWSVKTVKAEKPFSKKQIRLISGRNSPVFSQGFKDLFSDPAATGRAVLEIWNARVNEAHAEFDDLRIFVIIRNLATLEFLVMEHEALRYDPQQFTWTFNSNGNLIGRDVDSNVEKFTWQPSGSQFTIRQSIPSSATKFRITHHPQLIHSEAEVLQLAGYRDSWIEAVK